MGRTIGIDLGTTNSAVAIIEGGEAKVIANAEGANTTPSVVAFAKTNNDVLVGTTARRQNVTNVDRTISSVKRHMGERWSVDIDGKKYSPEEISARILMKLKKDAETYLGDEVTDAVITVPAYFNNAQREATKQAGKIAGLNVLRIVNEPTAAALAYGLEKAKEDEKILIYDLGGGTFDVSVLELGKEDDGFSTLEVVATAGDNKLGGDDFDKALTDYILADFKATSGVDLSGDKIAMQRIVEASEQAKKELSASSSTNVTLPYISMSSDGPLNLDIKVTRAKFEEITAGLLERTKKPVEQVLADAKLSLSEIDHVVLVGGSTRMPAVVELVEKLTGKVPSKNVNPDEVVALGAALQGAVLTGERKDVLLIDVTPLSLSIRTASDTATVMIERNTAIPTQRSETFTTAENNQSAVTIMVAQGERPVFSGNKVLGQFELQVPPAPAGVPQIQVTFALDANGVLDVSAKDLGTGKENKITISGGNSLTDAEVERMIKDAEAHAAEDAVKKANAETLNESETLVRQTTDLLAEYGDKVEESVKSEVESDLQALKDAISKEDFVEMKSAKERLNASVQKVGASLYAGSQPAADATSDAPTAEGDSAGAADSGEDDVVDAEIVEEEN